MARPTSGSGQNHAVYSNSKTETASTEKRQRVVSDKSHENLEQEYLNLRQQLTLQGKVRSNSDVGVDVIYEVNEMKGYRSFARSTQSFVDTNPKDFFQTDDLGMNHFIQHLANIKANCRKAKKSITGKRDQAKQGRRHSLKFKPLYEKQDLDESETMQIQDQIE